MIPYISVIYPNFDLKTGNITKNLLLWKNSKNVDPERFQMVIGTRKLGLDDYQILESHLREGDVIVEVESTGNDNAMWNAGVTKSTHENLLFVEGHVTPDQNFLYNLLKYIEINPGANAINTNSTNSKDSEFELLMDKWFDETLKLRARTHSFSFLTRQCFMLKRSVFEQIGPIEPDFEQFGPPYLSSRLAENNIEIVDANFSNLYHENEKKISHHHMATRSYIRGFVRATRRIDRVLLDRCFGVNPDFSEIESRLRQIQNRKWQLCFIGFKLGSCFRKIEIRAIEFTIMNINFGFKFKFKLFNKVHRLVVSDEYENELWRGMADNG